MWQWMIDASEPKKASFLHFFHSPHEVVDKAPLCSMNWLLAIPYCGHEAIVCQFVKILGSRSFPTGLVSYMRMSR